MKIRSITLNNYRLYKGVNKITFRDAEDKNLFLIFGENGFGKTTFLHALLWCLYGRLMFEIDESLKKELSVSLSRGGYNVLLFDNQNKQTREDLGKLINQHLVSKIRKHGYTSETEYLKPYSIYSVALDFSEVFIPSIPCRSLTVIRSYDLIREEEWTEILIDGAKNELTTEIGNEVFINDFILNKDIARFFFFDSERVVTLAESNNNDDKKNLCSAYSEVLGVKKYEDLKNNLENLRLRLRKKSSDIEGRNKLNALIQQRQKIEESIKKDDNKNEELEAERQSIRKDDEVLQLQLLREGNGATVEELNRLKDVVMALQKTDEQYKQQLKSYLEYAPFAICGRLLQQTKEQVNKDFLLAQSQRGVENQNNLLTNIISDLSTIIEDTTLSAAIKNKLQKKLTSTINKYQVQEVKGTALLTINKEILDEFMSVYSYVTSTYKAEFERLADDYKKNKQKLLANSRKVANMEVNENDSVIKEIRKKKDLLEKRLFDIEKEIHQYHEQKGMLTRDLSVVNKQISELSKHISVDDSDAKKDKLAENLIEEINAFLVSLKTEKKTSLERQIKATLNQLMHKTDFIADVNITIEGDLLEIALFDTKGKEIKKESLSKGEQQLYATALLKALVEESGIEFPVFIDSPLQKFDKSHSSKIITEFYPSISKQVILFPLLHKELTIEELQIMRPQINTTYFIQNNGNASEIKKVSINDVIAK